MAEDTEKPKPLKATYRPAPGDNQVTEAFGLIFEAGKAVTINNPDPRLRTKLVGNPYFETGEEQAPAEDKDRRESDERLTKALDGRTKEARQAREKAAQAEADAAAKEREAQAVQALAAARAPDEPIQQ